MPAPHHLLIPYAASRAPGAQEALKGLALPHLDRLLARLSTADASPGEETSLTPPHERALAQALGLGTQDGLIPWAAWHRLQQGQPPVQTPDDSAWAFITPCQWQVTTDHITLHDPAHLGLDEAASRELLAIVDPWFAEDGITLYYDQPTRWLASSPLFATLATASLERVQGRDVRAWMPDARKARTLHRLQSEMQMLLYTHPFNDARTASGARSTKAQIHGPSRRNAALPSMNNWRPVAEFMPGGALRIERRYCSTTATTAGSVKAYLPPFTQSRPWPISHVPASTTKLGCSTDVATRPNWPWSRLVVFSIAFSHSAGVVGTPTPASFRSFSL